MGEIEVVFFDLGETLGSPVFLPGSIHLADFQVFPFVPSLLQQLKERGLKMGLISNTGEDTGTQIDQVLESAGILHFFEPPLRIYSKDVGLTKDDPEIFRLATSRAGFSDSPSSCLFVGENDGERHTALGAGLRVSAHPQQVLEELEGNG
jgi:leucyl aminopeptidase